MHLRSKNKTRDFNARAMSVRAPSTVDAEARTLRAVMTTEAPVLVFDYEHGDMVPEILLMSGMQAPEIGQVPFLDSHDRSSVESLLGSARDFQPVDVNGVAGMDALVSFASTEDALKAFTKMREGHLTDVSVGYQPIERVWIKDGEKGVVAGRTYDGPCYVVTRWSLCELSATPIGADSNAKSRASQNKPESKERSMNKHLRKLLLARGMTSSATDEQAELFFRAYADDVQAQLKTESERLEQEERAAANQPPAAPGTPGPQPQGGGDPSSRAAAIEEATRAERDRIQGIRDLGATCRMEEREINNMIVGGFTLDQARAAGIARLAQANPVLGGHVEVGRSDSDKFRAAAIDGLAFRVGVRHADEKLYAPGYDGLRTLGLRKIAMLCLERSGVQVSRMSDMQMAEMVLRSFASGSTSDFPAIMSGLANKVARKAYEEQPATWRPICSVSSASDFKQMERPQMSSFSSLELIGENGEYKEGKFSDDVEKYAVKTYGKTFSLTRQAIVNDDLGMFLRLPKAFGSACARLLGDLVFNNILLANPNMNDGVALFHSTHGNLYSTASDVLASALDAIRAAMLLQKDPGGAVLGLTPAVMVVPASQMSKAETILQSQAVVASGMSSSVKNLYYNALDLVVEARLDGHAKKPWFLTCRPGMMDTIEVSFLDGREEPYIEEGVEFNTDAVKYKVRMDVGAAPMDPRGMYKVESL